MEKIRKEMDESNREIADLLRRSANTSRTVEVLIQELLAPSNLFQQHPTPFTVPSASITTAPDPENTTRARK